MTTSVISNLTAEAVSGRDAAQTCLGLLHHTKVVEWHTLGCLPVSRLFHMLMDQGIEGFAACLKDW